MTPFSLPQAAYLRHDDLAKFATQSSKDLIVDHVEVDGRVIVRNRKFAERLVAWVNQNLLKRTDPRAAELSSLFVRHLSGLGSLGERALGKLDPARAQVGLRSRDVRLVFETLGAGGSARFRFDNVDWRERHREEAQTLAEQFLSGGAAFDAVMQASGLEWAAGVIDMQAYDDRFASLLEGFLPELTKQEWELPLSEMVHAMALRALLSLAPEKPAFAERQTELAEFAEEAALVEEKALAEEVTFGEGSSDLSRATVAAQAHYQSMTSPTDRVLDDTVLAAMMADASFDDSGAEQAPEEAPVSTVNANYQQLSARLDKLEALRRTHVDAVDAARTVTEHLMQSAMANLYANLIAAYRDACCKAEAIASTSNLLDQPSSPQAFENSNPSREESLSSNPRRKDVLDRIQHAIDAALQAKNTPLVAAKPAPSKPSAQSVNPDATDAQWSSGDTQKDTGTISIKKTALRAIDTDAHQKLEDLETIRTLLASRHRYGGGAAAWRHDCAEALEQLTLMRRETLETLKHVNDPKQMAEVSRLLQSINEMAGLLSWESSISDRVFGGQYLAHLVHTEGDEDLWEAIGTVMPAIAAGDRYAAAAEELRRMIPALPRANPKDVPAVGELCASRRQEVYSAIQILEGLSASAPEQLDAEEVGRFIEDAEHHIVTMRQKGFDFSDIDNQKLTQALDHYIDIAVHTLARAEGDESARAELPFQMLDRLSAARIELLWLESLNADPGLVEVDRMIHQTEGLQTENQTSPNEANGKASNMTRREALDHYAEHLHNMRRDFIATLQQGAADGQWEQVAASHALEGLFTRRTALLKSAQQA